MKKLLACAAIALFCLSFYPSEASAFYLWRYREDATDCTALTDGKVTDLCYENDADTFYKCEPTAGDCDTAAEWRKLNTTGNATTATTLAANGANCGIGNSPLGVDASGAAEGCFAVLTAEVDGSTTNEIQNLFETIATSSGTSPVADSSADTLTLTAGTGVTVTGDSSTDTVTIGLDSTLSDIADGTIAEDLVNTANPWADNEVADTITASNYLPLAGGTLTGELKTAAQGIEGTATDTLTDCSTFSATGGGIFYDDSEGKWKKCQDNTLSDLDTTGAGATITVEENDVTVDGSTTNVDFLGADFDVSSSPAGESNVSIAAALTRDTEWDTESEVQTAWGSVNILLETEIDASSELAALMDDETGSGALVFGTSPTIATPALTLSDGNGSAPTTDGLIKYDRTTERLQVGDGSTTREFVDVGTLTDTKLCTWDATGKEIDCNTTASGGSGSTALNLPIYSAKLTGAFTVFTPPTADACSQGAQIDAGDGNWRLLFDATTDECATWQFVVPDNYSSTPALNVYYAMSSATSLDVEFEASIMCVTSGDSADIGTASFSNVATATETVPGTAGYMKKLTITLTDDSCSAGDIAFVVLSTDANDATNDDATGDREVVGVEFDYA